MKTKTMKTLLLASAFAAPVMFFSGQSAFAGPMGLPDGTSCDWGDPICVKDAAKWTAQDVGEAIGKLEGMVGTMSSDAAHHVTQAINDLKDKKYGKAVEQLGQAGIDVVHQGGRGVQIVVESAEQVLHDRSGATKGYVDRTTKRGVDQANHYTDGRIGDLDAGKSPEELHHVTNGQDAGAAKWNVNKTGQVVDGNGKVIRPHLTNDTKLAKALGVLDGYYTVDKATGGLVLHNMLGDTMYKPGHISGNLVHAIGDVLNGGGVNAEHLQKFLDDNGLKFADGALTTVGKAGKGAAATLDDVASKLRGKNEAAVVAAGGKDGQYRPTTVKEYVDEGDAKVREYADKGDAKLYDEGKAAYDDLSNRINNIKIDRQGIVDEAVSQANQYTDMRFNQLNGKIKSVRKEARQAAAIGIAASSLRFDDTPGKISFSAGGGAWRGEGAGAFGVGYTHPNGKVRFNVNGAFTSDNIGGGGAVTYTFN